MLPVKYQVRDRPILQEQDFQESRTLEIVEVVDGQVFLQVYLEVRGW